MADSLMTIEDAAQHLQVSTRTVHTYIKEGFLSTTKKRNDRRRLLDALEIEELRKEREEHGAKTLLSRKEVRGMEVRLSKLESQMRVVLRVLDAQVEPLGLNPANAKDLYTACLLEQKNGSWELDEYQSWVEILLRVTEDDFIQMVELSPCPYKPFLSLCMTMTVSIVRHKDYETSLERQRVHRLLSEARRRLRVAAVLFSETQGTVPTDLRKMATEIPSSLVDALERKVRRTIEKVR